MRTLALLLTCLALPATAQDVELELVLLADASGSIDAAEIRFQRLGYAKAITDPRVIDAITRTAYGKIAVTYVEWGDYLIPTVIDQNPCAHLRMPRDMIFHGWSMRLFQAWQHSATMSS